MNKAIRLIPTLLCLIIFIACQQEETSNGNGETTTVRLNIGGLSTNNGQGGIRYVDSSPYEGLRTLRVIVTDKAMTTIHYNEKTTVAINPENPTSADNTASITIPNVPIGEVNFYVIANEESIGETYDDNTLMNDEKDNNKLLFIDKEETPYFPKQGPDIRQYGLPMSGKKSVIINKDTKAVSMELERAVTKIALTVENATSSDITLQDVIFGPFFGDRFYVFPEGNLDVPNNSKYSQLSYTNLNMIIPANKSTEKLSAYLYPTYAFTQGGTDNPYTIAIKTNVNEYGKLVFAPNVNSFRRNTQVNINARITTTTGITLKFEVTEWDNYTVNVPDFN